MPNKYPWNLRTYTGEEFYSLIEKAGALTPEIIGIVQDLQPQRQFVLPIKFGESSSVFYPADITIAGLTRSEREFIELEKAFNNCKRILERLSMCWIIPPAKIEFGIDRATTLTVEIGI